MSESYRVVRAFERHEGKALRKYTRGKILSAKEAARIPPKSWSNLMVGGFVQRVPEDFSSMTSSKEVVDDDRKGA